MQQVYTATRIFDGEKFHTDAAVIVENGLITEMCSRKSVSEDQVTDLGDVTLAPSFIDLQVYGGKGMLFATDITAEAIEATYRECLEGGTSHFMITVATNTYEVFDKCFEAVREYWKRGGKGLLGLHLEGPYLNMEKRGAHLKDCIRTPDLEEVKELFKRGGDVIRMMTIAPEVVSEEVLEFLVGQNILLSAGHSNATYEQAAHSFDKGIFLATHLFNAMSPLGHRAPGMVGAILDHPTVCCSIVADGIHVQDAVVRIAAKVMGERLFLITDAVTESLHGAYVHVFKGDRYTLPDGTLSGSCLTMLKAVQRCVEVIGLPLTTALRMASFIPAHLAGKGNVMGRIEKGYKASLCFFDDDLQLKGIIVDGQIQ